ncbi:hypothetical protein EV714DRAFT_274143 [Schizophyllum commune]
MRAESCGHTAFCNICGHSTTTGAFPCPVFEDTKWQPNLRSGAQPTDVERASLSAELEALQAAADAHRRALDDIRSRLDTVQAQIDRRSCFLYSPIRRLADELMEEILEFVWSSTSMLHDEEVVIDVRGTAELPALLASARYPPPHVCAWWRHLVLRLPTLRPYFYVDIQALHKGTGQDSGHPNDLQGRLRHDLIRLPHPDFNIRLFSHPGLPCPVDDLDEETVQTARWRRASLSHLPWKIVQNLASAHLPRLVHANIDLASDEGEDQDIQFGHSNGRPSFFENAPHLRSFSLMIDDDVDLTGKTLPFTLPWLRLRSAVVNDCPLDPCLEILSKCTALRSFYWSDEQDEDEEEEEDEVNQEDGAQTVTSSVMALTLVAHGYGTSGVQQLLQRITMPRLVDLELWCIPEPSLLPFLQRSGCRLTSLSLHVSRTWVSAAEVNTLLCALPDLEDLTFHYLKGDDDRGSYYGTETMKDIFGGLERALLNITIGASFRPTYLPRLGKLHILCDERCDFNSIGFLHRCRFVQGEATKELWLKTPVKPVHIKEILEVAEQGRVEVYGLKKCAAMYAALPAFDGPKSRKDPPDEES